MTAEAAALAECAHWLSVIAEHLSALVDIVLAFAFFCALTLLVSKLPRES